MENEGVRIKNTFVEVEEPLDLVRRTRRRTRTAPSFEFSLAGAGGRHEDKLSVQCVEALEEADFEMEDTGADAADGFAATVDADEASPVACKLPSMRTPKTPGSKPTRSALKSSRCRAVMFWAEGESARLEVKNTFFTFQDLGSPCVGKSKSVPVDFSPQESELSLSPTEDEPVEFFAGIAGEGSPAAPSTPGGICRLRTLSFNSMNAAGPHLGLLWAPDGQAWAPELAAQFDDSRQMPAPRPPPPTVEASPKAGSPGGFADLWELSQTAQGCREVQSMLEDAACDEARAAIAAHLQGHMLEAASHPYGNFVVAKVVATLPPTMLQFVVDEFTGEGAVQSAKHKFGCRIVQRLVEKCSPSQVKGIARAILDDFDAVARHPFGNYVIQNFLEHGTEEHKDEIVRRITKDIRGLATDNFGATVVGTSLADVCSEERRREVARSMAAEPGLLTFVACTRHGHVAVARALQALQGQELQASRQELLAEVESLSASRFGKNVVALL